MRHTTIAAVLVLGLTGCNGILDVSPRDQLSDDAVFADPNLAQAFVNDMYRGMGQGLYEIMLSSMADETHFIHVYQTDKVVQARITPSDRGALDDNRFNHFDWSDNYTRIRQANTFLRRIDSTTFDTAWKQRMKGEAYFLRAYFYHNLLRMYGGVPLITKVYGLNEDYKVARNTFKETVDFIVANADSAAALLPVSYSAADVGRATKGAALALKARVLLYAASDLYNVNPRGQPETGYSGSQDRTALRHAAAPYANRDPRLYASSLHDGAPWRTRPTDAQKFEPNNVIETFRALTYVESGTTKVAAGLYTRKGPIENWNGGYSGYYIRKFVDPTVDHQFVVQQVPWIFFRYAEIVLNYAEASIELNELGDAMTALNQIRRRAGMPEFSGLDQATLRDESRNERRVEMAFEEQRFFDVRRWMIAPQVFSKNAGGINIYLDGDSPTDRSTWRNYRYQTYDVQQRAWNDKMYFMPIRLDELNRNNLLKQNPGY